MENKRSKGITILAWLIIIFSLLNLISRVDYLFKASRQPVLLGISDYLYLAISVISLIASVYLLKVKNWARLLTIFMSLVVFVDIALKIPALIKQIPLGSMLFILLLLVLIPLIFEAVVIFYFTRPAVRGQFCTK